MRSAVGVSAHKNGSAGMSRGRGGEGREGKERDERGKEGSERWREEGQSKQKTAKEGKGREGRDNRNASKNLLQKVGGQYKGQDRTGHDRIREISLGPWDRT